MDNLNVSGVYKVPCLVNGKFYIGSSKNMRIRWGEHWNERERAKTEKLADIKRWYKNGLLNDEQKKMIESTNLNSNKEVTKLWKELNKSFQ